MSSVSHLIFIAMMWPRPNSGAKSDEHNGEARLLVVGQIGATFNFS